MRARRPKRRKEKRGEGERASWLFDSFLYVFFPSPLACLCKLGQPGGLFVLPEGLTLVLELPFVLFSWAFPFLVFQTLPFWTPFTYSNYLKVPCEVAGGANPMEVGMEFMCGMGQQGVAKILFCKGLSMGRKDKFKHRKLFQLLVPSLPSTMHCLSTLCIDQTSPWAHTSSTTKSNIFVVPTRHLLKS